MSTLDMIQYHSNSMKIRRVSPYQFRLAVKTRLKNLTKKRKKQIYRRLNLIHYKYPFIVEKKVQIAISKISKRFVDRFENWFKSHIDTWKEQRKRYDSWDSQVDFFLRDLEKEMDLFYSDPVSFGVDIRRQAKSFSEYIHVLVERELGRQIGTLLKEVYLGSDNWWNDVQSLWIKEYTDRIKNLTYGYTTRMRETIFTAVRENWSFEKIEQHIAVLNESFTKTRVNFIARDLVGALNGIVEQKSQQDIGIDTYLWNTMADERVRGRPGGKYPNAIPSHWAMDGKICDWRNSGIYSSDMRTWVPRTVDMPKEHPGIAWACFLGDTVFSSYVPTEKLYRRRYRGEFTKFILSDDSSIVCTPNHPFLGIDGRMVSAKDFNIGDYFTQVSDQSPLISIRNDEQRKPRFDNCFSSLAEYIPMQQSTTYSRSDFHGDGIINEEIQVISLETELWDDLEPFIQDGSIDFFFSKAEACLPDLPSARSLLSNFITLGFPNVGSIRFLCKLLAFFKSQSFHSEEIGLRAISRLNTVFSENSINNRSANAIFFGKTQYAFSHLKFMDDVFIRKLLFIGRRTFELRNGKPQLFESFTDLISISSQRNGDVSKGFPFKKSTVYIVDKSIINMDTHVYNLQTMNSIYSITENDIIVNNCRCMGRAFFIPFLYDVQKEIDREENS